MLMVTVVSVTTTYITGRVNSAVFGTMAESFNQAGIATQTPLISTAVGLVCAAPTVLHAFAPILITDPQVIDVAHTGTHPQVPLPLLGWHALRVIACTALIVACAPLMVCRVNAITPITTGHRTCAPLITWGPSWQQVIAARLVLWMYTAAGWALVI
jgi:hypothetical protein